MTRETESLLIDFCVEQRSGFVASAWPRFTAVTPLELAATVRYLAGVSWYGHRAELHEVAVCLRACSFPELARESGFDASRFAGRLKAHLRHAGQALPG